MLPWHWHGTYCSELSVVCSGRVAAIPDKTDSSSGESKKTSDLTPGPLGLALVWFVAILAMWVGGRRLLEI